MGSRYEPQNAAMLGFWGPNGPQKGRNVGFENGVHNYGPQKDAICIQRCLVINTDWRMMITTAFHVIG